MAIQFFWVSNSSPKSVGKKSDGMNQGARHAHIYKCEVCVCVCEYIKKEKKRKESLLKL